MIEDILNQKVMALNNNEGVEMQKGDKSWQNLIADEYDFQDKSFGSYLDAPLNWVLNTANGSVNHVYNVSMLFFKKSELDYNWKDHDVVLHELRSIVDSFCVSIANSQDFNNTNFNNNFRAWEAINIFDVNVDAILLTFQVKSLNLSVC